MNSFKVFLELTPSLSAPYYSPLARNETQRKIIFLLENIADETKNAIKSIFTSDSLEEINNRDANDMLLRSTGLSPALTSGSNNQLPDNA